ncbi:hypothetical protein M2323_000221 [Rhodoblastus acidophilus]|nr:DUF4263 domain-containing protein [Rhodoblastus acidophilus]MCW2282272.1 hypothetical protein [Rhodoblastus acidophilus]MCW2331323.1 hypothetical protein [Rhodoblastus acidophilus]
MSDEIAGAVTQVQKTTFEFGRDHYRDELKDELGTRTGNSVYAIEPRSFLVAGNMKQIANNDDKITCFELFRRNTRAPEIITFDELYSRAGCIVDNISRAVDKKETS